MTSIDRVLVLCLAMGACVGGGCASVISGRRAEITINSEPSAAHVVVHNEKGENVATAVTPTKVSLKRGKGFFKKAHSYVATIDKPGYEPAQVSIQSTLNPWIVGNVVLGGVIGIAADSATGAMWQLTPNEIDQRLIPYRDPHYSQSQSGEILQTTLVSE